MRLWTALAAVTLFAAAAFARDLPPAPKTGLIWDDAKLLAPEDAARVAQLQDEALRASNTPVVVATIARVSDYDESRIETLARRWFDRWEIGTMRANGGANDGILLLVATQDRRARIELGADWGADWNDEAQTIMDGTIVPRFKAGDGSRGILDGVSELAAMARRGPKSPAPSHPVRKVAQAVGKYSAFDPTWAVAVTLVGLALTIYGAVANVSKWVMAAGIALVLIGMLTYVVILALAVWARVRSRSSGGGWSAGGGSSGGFSGGFSGGGGASGSW